MNKTALDQYEIIVTDALKFCLAKLRKSFKTAFIQLIVLCMAPRAEQTPDKAYLSNTYMLKRILSKSGMKPNRTLNAKLIKDLFGIVAEAA